MKNVTIRDICETDKESYFKLQKEIWIASENVDRDREQLWKMKLEDEQINCTITDGETIYGFCGIKRKVDTYPEVEIELFKKYIHKGIGYRAIILLLEKGANEKGFKTFIAKAAPDNYPSILLFRKAGAKPAGIIEHILINKNEVEDYNIQHSELITDNLKSVAKLFQVEVQSLLTHNLIFQIDMPIKKEPQFDLELKGDIHYEKELEHCIYKYYKESIRNLFSKLTEII